MSRSPRLQVPLKDFLRIAERDGWVCHWCGTGYSATDPWEIDHVIALAQGGTNLIGNLALCHRSCNADKSALAAVAWHLAHGLQQLAAMGRAEACEAVLARAVAALAEDEA